MLAHVFGESTHSDGCEEVDTEPSVLRVVGRENTSQCWLQFVSLEAFGQLFHADALGEVLDENFDEDTGR